MLLRLADSGNTTHVFLNTSRVERVYAQGPVNPPTDLTWQVVVQEPGSAVNVVQSGLTQTDAEAAAQGIAVALGIDWE